MAIYSKTSKQMVVDLINAGNPNLPFPINATDFEFSTPEVIADPGNGHNTRIRVMSKPNTNYVGNVVVTYRRLTMGYVFRNMVLSVQNWIANSGANGTALTTIRNLLPLFSDKYGFNFVPEEWNDGTLTGYHGVRGDAFSISPVPTNLAFIGSIQAKWEIGERTLESLLPVDQVGGRRYPGGNDFSGTHKYWVTPDGFDFDFTQYATSLESISMRVFGYTGSGGAAEMQLLGNLIANNCKVRDGAPMSKYRHWSASNSSTDPDDTAYGYRGSVGGLNGITPIRLSLPNVNFPEANSEFYNRAIVVTLPDDCPWGAGRIFLHYNI